MSALNISSPRNVKTNRCWLEITHFSGAAKGKWNFSWKRVWPNLYLWYGGGSSSFLPADFDIPSVEIINNVTWYCSGAVKLRCEDAELTVGRLKNPQESTEYKHSTLIVIELNQSINQSILGMVQRDECHSCLGVGLPTCDLCSLTCSSLVLQRSWTLYWLSALSGLCTKPCSQKRKEISNIATIRHMM